MERETVFTMEATPVKYGPGAVADAGWELARLGVRRALLVTDAGVAALGIADRVREAAATGVAAVLVTARLPVDIRHESKVDRRELARRATRVLAGTSFRRLRGRTT